MPFPLMYFGAVALGGGALYLLNMRKKRTSSAPTAVVADMDMTSNAAWRVLQVRGGYVAQYNAAAVRPGEAPAWVTVFKDLFSTADEARVVAQTAASGLRLGVTLVDTGFADGGFGLRMWNVWKLKNSKYQGTVRRDDGGEQAILPEADTSLHARNLALEAIASGVPS